MACALEGEDNQVKKYDKILSRPGELAVRLVNKIKSLNKTLLKVSEDS